jgi:hypothetical protein
VRRKDPKGTAGSIVLEYVIVVASVLTLVVLLTPVISHALRAVNRSVQTPFGTALSGRITSVRADVLVVNQGTGRRPATPRARAAVKPGPKGAAVAVVLNADERAELEFVTQRWFVPARDVARARGLLMAAGGETSASIARKLGTTEATVNAWRREFMAQAAECGLEGGRATCRRRFVRPASGRAAETRLGAARRPLEERV